MVPSPLPIHQIVVMRLLDVFLAISRQTGGQVFTAPFDIVLSDFDVVEPDLIYFGPDAATRIKLREHVRFRPDLAIEVLSPSTARIDRGRKRELLARHGLPEYWLVDPDAKRLDVFILAGSHYEDARVLQTGRYESPTTPRLSIEIEPLFAGLD